MSVGSQNTMKKDKTNEITGSETRILNQTRRVS